MRSSKISFVAVCVLFLFATGLCYAADAPKLKLKLQTFQLPDETKRNFAKFTEMIHALSNGQIEVTLYPVGALVPVREMLDAVGKGVLDMAQVVEGYFMKVVPVSEIAAGIPFLFRDLDDSKLFMWNKGFVELLREGYAKHNVYHFPWETYPIGLMTKKPVKTIEDLKKMKIRAHSTMAGLLGKVGAAGVFIPGGELYTALATGVVDGAQWGDAGPMYAMKFHEVLKNYMYPEPVVGAWNSIVINMDLWKKLTPQQRGIIEAAALCGGDYSYNSTRLMSRTRLMEMKEKWNVNVIALPNADVEKMRQYSLEFQAELAKKDPLCAKGMTMIRGFMKEMGYEK
ncbi:MAG: TRAP transporter substrate-binding protein DctP [Deltaproteobacteria bacterium]|nr:TRAP transporter substrate-binding protein DctP [Deltaproteobacteria bacterium]